MRRGARHRDRPAERQGVPHRAYGPCQRAHAARHSQRRRDGACRTRHRARQRRSAVGNRLSRKRRTGLCLEPVLRIIRAVARAKNCSCAPKPLSRSRCGEFGHARTVGRFWLPAYRQAWANLQTELAQRYDNEPLIREVSITQCMSFTAEPFFVPTDPTENVMKRLRNAGFNDADYKDCLLNAVADYAPWQSTRLVLAVNPYRTTFGGSGDVAFTEQVMLACRNAIGERCVFDNHDLDSNLASPLVPLYAYMRQLGAEIEFQT